MRELVTKPYPHYTEHVHVKSITFDIWETFQGWFQVSRNYLNCKGIWLSIDHKSQGLSPEDARRLGQALIAAADREEF